MVKPDVDYIGGLSPAISIDQKGASHNPRSTVGTVTEVYDYLRLLFARVGKPHCATVWASGRSASPFSRSWTPCLGLPTGELAAHGHGAGGARHRKGEYREPLRGRPKERASYVSVSMARCGTSTRAV